MEESQIPKESQPSAVPVVVPVPVNSVWKSKPVIRDEPQEIAPTTKTNIISPKTTPITSASITPSIVTPSIVTPSIVTPSIVTPSNTTQTTSTQEPLPNILSSPGKTEKLVLDTVTFIKQVKFENVEIEYYTVEEVLHEVRDSKARFYLENFPHIIHERRPTPESLVAVTKFAQKTGDYTALSKVDLLVLALTYTLEQEAHGNVDHLRSDPPELHDTTERLDFFKPIETSTVDGTTEMVGVGEWDEDEEDDDEGWITEDNIKEYTESYTGVVSKDTENRYCQVACLTSDFAMQNVILQMNMNVMSVDGLAIKTVKKWINRCYACLKLVKDPRQNFCGNCGSLSLHKVSYSVSKDGEIAINLPTRRRNLRGTIYPIPLPKGGKHNTDLNFAQQVSRKPKSYMPNLNDPDGEFLQQMKNPVRSPQVIGYGKKNPNVARRAIGKKNKTKSGAQF